MPSAAERSTLVPPRAWLAAIALAAALGALDLLAAERRALALGVRGAWVAVLAAAVLLLVRERRLRAAEEREAAERVAAERRRAGEARALELRQVAEGIAHEVNNPLAFVKVNVEWVRDQLRLGQLDRAEAQGALEEASVGIGRIARTVRELRAGARRLAGGEAASDGGAPAPDPGRHVATRRAPDPVALDRFTAAVLANDRRAALAVALDVLDRDGLGCLYEGIFRPALEEVGRRWEWNELGVADEHLVTAIVDETLASLHPLVPWPHGGPVAVVACAPRERHALGARMVADLLALDGWATTFLGADTPADALARRVARSGAALVAVSVTMPHHLSDAREAVAAVRRAAPGVRVLAGGGAVAQLRDPAGYLGVDAIASSSFGAVDAARALRGGAPAR